MAIPVSATPDHFAVEQQIIDENTSSPLDAVGPLRAGLQAGKVVGSEIQNIEEIRKATEFEQLLQSGEEGMNLALSEAESKGVDLTGVPDPKLYLRTPEASANWYNMLSSKLQSHLSKIATTEGFEKISKVDDPEANIAGFSQLVEAGQLKATDAAGQVRDIRKKKALQEFVTGPRTIISDKVAETETPDGEVTVMTVQSFSPPRETLSADIKKKYGGAIPPAILTAGTSAAKKLGIPTDLLLSLVARENAKFQVSAPTGEKGPDGKPISSAKGLGQLINSTAKAMLKVAHNKGLIPKDVNVVTATNDGEMNMIMTGLYFQQNLKEFEGSVEKALIAHRLGPGNVEKFFAGEPIIANGTDQSPDARDWLGDIFETADPSILGDVEIEGGDPNNPFSTVEGLNDEILRLSSDVDLSTEPFVKQRISLLQKMKADLVKETTKKEKEKAKSAKGDKKSAAAARSIRALIGFAKQAGTDGFVTGTFKKFIASVTKGEFFPDVKTLADFTGGLAGQIAKGIGGESGRLTDQDRVFAMRMIPTNNEGEEVFFRKLQFLDAMAQTLERKDLSDEQKGRLLTDTIYKTAADFNKRKGKKSLFPQSQFESEYKANPSDNLIRTFLIANSKKPSPDNVSIVRESMRGDSTPAATPALISPKAAVPLQSGSATDLPPPQPQQQSPGLGLDINIPEITPGSTIQPRQ